jgi:hypothetical protein
VTFLTLLTTFDIAAVRESAEGKQVAQDWAAGTNRPPKGDGFEGSSQYGWDDKGATDSRTRFESEDCRIECLLERKLINCDGPPTAEAG